MIFDVVPVNELCGARRGPGKYDRKGQVLMDAQGIGVVLNLRGNVEGFLSVSDQDGYNLLALGGIEKKKLRRPAADFNGAMGLDGSEAFGCDGYGKLLRRSRNRASAFAVRTGRGRRADCRQRKSESRNKPCQHIVQTFAFKHYITSVFHGFFCPIQKAGNPPGGFPAKTALQGFLCRYAIF